MLKDLQTYKNITERLSRSIESGRVSHAYLFEGGYSAGKLALAENFVKAILCENTEGDCCEVCISCRKVSHGNHEDVMYIEAVKGSVKVEQVKELQYYLKKKPVGARNIVIIKDADTMTPESQNKLLKTLEEPAIGTVIILLSENMENLASTILSRCVIFRLGPYEAAEYENALEGAIKISDMLLAGGSYREITESIAEFTPNRDTAIAFLDAMESWLRDLAVYGFDPQGKLLIHTAKKESLRKKYGLYKAEVLDQAITVIEEAKNDISRGLNLIYTIKKMILKISA